MKFSAKIIKNTDVDCADSLNNGEQDTFLNNCEDEADYKTVEESLKLKDWCDKHWQMRISATSNQCHNFWRNKYHRNTAAAYVKVF